MTDIDTSWLRVTCHYCPTIVEGTDPHGRNVYLRYRWGVARVVIDGNTVWSQRYGDDYDGVMDPDVAMEIAASVADSHRPPQHCG